MIHNCLLIYSAKLLVTTGDRIENEVIDLLDENSVCDDLLESPYGTRAAIGGLINGIDPIVCGGYGNANECFIIGTNEQIQLNHARGDGSGIVVNNKVPTLEIIFLPSY